MLPLVPETTYTETVPKGREECARPVSSLWAAKLWAQGQTHPAKSQPRGEVGVGEAVRIEVSELPDPESLGIRIWGGGWMVKQWEGMKIPRGF